MGDTSAGMFSPMEPGHSSLKLVAILKKSSDF